MRRRCCLSFASATTATAPHSGSNGGISSLPKCSSPTELRQAYLQAAKHLHPDRRCSSERHAAAQEFAELHRRFEEATEALKRADAVFGKAAGDASATGAPGATATASRWQAWTNVHQHSYPWHAHGCRQQHEIPVVGLPARLVYGCVASFVAAFLAIRYLLPKTVTSGNVPEESHQSEEIMKARHVRSKSLRESESLIKERNLAAYFNAQFRRTKSRTSSNNGRIGPQLREGLSLSAVHVAAEDGYVWWLERCGASSACSRKLDIGDERRKDTPLHRCARRGEFSACATLLRLGAKPGARNAWQLLPEDLATHEGFHDVASLLRIVRLNGAALSTKSVNEDVTNAAKAVAGHPDGLGMLCYPSGGVNYSGPFPTESLRHAVNMAAGQGVLSHLQLPQTHPSLLPPPEQPRPGSDDAMEAALEHVRVALEGTGFDLEQEPISKGEPQEVAMDVDFIREVWTVPGDGSDANAMMVKGLLVYETPGKASPDAAGHWFAVRTSSEGSASAAPAGRSDSDAQSSVVGFRLDPVRGPYRLTAPDLAELLRRYRSWRLVCKDSRGINTPLRF